jgi:hypothetical protein
MIVAARHIMLQPLLHNVAELEPELVAQFCNPSYWEAKTGYDVKAPAPQDRDLQ